MRKFQQTNPQNHWPAISKVIDIASDVRSIFKLLTTRWCYHLIIFYLKTHESVGVSHRVTFPDMDEDNCSVLDRSRDLSRGSLRRKESVSQSV